jgi:hypothetical protein
MPHNNAFEQILMRHEEEIDKIKDDHHALDKNIAQIQHDVKELLNKSQEQDKLEQRIEVLESVHHKRQLIINMFYALCRFLYQIRWILFVIFLFTFAFDLDFRIQNPVLVQWINNKIPPIFNEKK